MTEQDIFSDYSDPKIIRRIRQLKLLGTSNEDVARLISEEFKVKESPEVIKGLMKGFTIKGSEFMEKDKEIALIYKRLLYDLIDEGRDNMRVMQEIKRIMFVRLKVAEQSDLLEEKGKINELMTLVSKIQEAIRTQNDTIKTLKLMLDTLGLHKKEVSIETKSFSLGKEQLMELEKGGYISINARYRESMDIGSEQNENDKDSNSNIEEDDIMKGGNEDEDGK